MYRLGYFGDPRRVCGREKARAGLPREEPNTPSRIRTYDLRIRSPLLYPTELWARRFVPCFFGFLTLVNVIRCRLGRSDARNGDRSLLHAV